ncbi:methylthioribose-1-phosphate isomerase [Desulfonatronum thiosulfatophilum]|uniref:Methylthioribose-1-phosphate isomerase n=1 Tax=Desulfonatronum thiosulfatophilum TaxID=617002 RepID=A0A1G6C1Q0_9BACT|nr:S-methyl-5-thioribose-1-phosphate isomerase [Desulfonatronum thiosulfatophilum]SDB26792.1 methylthioribose-1-phosphate isomerase [Desulfonatronum thiosulfatophilum]
MQPHIQFKPESNELHLLDQRLLPRTEEWFVCRNMDDIIFALKEMVIRGAPAIGVTAAYGCCIAAGNADPSSSHWVTDLDRQLTELAQARPTAVNLQWAVNLMRETWNVRPDIQLGELHRMWIAQAEELHRQDDKINREMGRHGAALLQNGDTVMTHCNAGALATGAYGTALGVIRAAVESGKRIHVLANETRPFLQGARLTAYELAQDEIPVTVCCDNAVGLLMAKGMVQAVVVGADRVAANGDAANKIGTYTVAVLAKRHNIPFYVAVPFSTIDFATASGEDIPIEERTPLEVTHIQDRQITPDEVPVLNFAFDVTPAELITALITEKGVIKPGELRNFKS